MWKGKLAGGQGELREAVGEVLPCPWSQWTAQPGVLWVECLQEMRQSVTQECGLPAGGFLSSCLLGYWVLFRAFFFPLPL